MPLIRDREQIRAMLQLDPVWAVYPIGDLSPAMFPVCTWHRPEKGSPGAIALLMRGFPTAILWASADESELAAMLNEIDDENLFLQVRPHHIPVLETRYEVSNRREMVRMALRPAEFRAAEEGDAVRLRAADLGALRRLYQDGEEAGEEPEFFFDSMVEEGVFYGMREGSDLVGVAGTHLVNFEERVAAIGNVYVRRDRRGRGLAQALTTAVARELIENGAVTICLNVRTNNEPAKRAYENLGFRPHCVYFEAYGSRRG